MHDNVKIFIFVTFNIFVKANNEEKLPFPETFVYCAGIFFFFLLSTIKKM